MQTIELTRAGQQAATEKLSSFSGERTRLGVDDEVGLLFSER